jgi:thiol-disulfide isomerase/thioredoxin
MLKRISHLILMWGFISLMACGQKVQVVNTEQLLEAIKPHSDSLHVVNFWATWCKPCIAEMPHFVRYAEENPDVQFTFISLDFADDVAKVEQFSKVKNLPGQQLLMNNVDYNSWLPMVDSTWQGNIPFTILSYRGHKMAHAGSISSYEELLKRIEQIKIKTP